MTAVFAGAAALAFGGPHPAAIPMHIHATMIIIVLFFFTIFRSPFCYIIWSLNIKKRSASPLFN
jgi:hypothetical protein